VTYGAALACAGLFNLFALLLIAAHGLSLLALRAGPAAGRRQATGTLRPGRP
jgi:hypothetical protein